MPAAAEEEVPVPDADAIGGHDRIAHDFFAFRGLRKESPSGQVAKCDV